MQMHGNPGQTLSQNYYINKIVFVITTLSYRLYIDGVMTKRRKRHSQLFTGEVKNDLQVELCPRACPPEEAVGEFAFHVNKPFVYYILGLVLLSAPILPRESYKFNANHPFVYYLRDGHSGAVLFVGRYIITSVMSAMDFPPQKIYPFHADHPFIYFIKVEGTVLFAGLAIKEESLIIYNDPPKVFHADRSFVYYIKIDSVVTFIGRYTSSNV
ncbi:hypothetical protein NQ317_015166 [Molorchus minor]|uniref:Uncharacterized protein n=1 Tax=Molorchus minor TaxID=1323400 RepID=A0ABQ9K5U1_9CUCU|nr:hypothetical protein NQ317_015166 [Molorchus minor]